jgi:hypothetical protein
MDRLCGGTWNPIVGGILMSDHDIAAMCARQVNGLQDKLARVRAGLQDLQHEAATLTLLYGDNATRAAWATVEQRVKALLEVCGG